LNYSSDFIVAFPCQADIFFRGITPQPASTPVLTADNLVFESLERLHLTVSFGFDKLSDKDAQSGAYCTNCQSDGCSCFALAITGINLHIAMVKRSTVLFDYLALQKKSSQ
jgi:hypothetical protein